MERLQLTSLTHTVVASMHKPSHLEKMLEQSFESQQTQHIKCFLIFKIHCLDLNVGSETVWHWAHSTGPSVPQLPTNPITQADLRKAPRQPVVLNRKPLET